MDKVNEYLKKNYLEHESSLKAKGYWCDGYPIINDRVTCADGYSISIQGTEFHYCYPRKNKSWPYSEVELGFPNLKDELITEYADADEELCETPTSIDTVYGYVPIEIVNELIEKHGGIVD